MRGWIALGALLGAVSLTGPARAQTPPERVGFQMALRTGYSVPMGATSKDATGQEEKMSDVFSGQVPFMVDVGGKPIPNLFLGAYTGFGIGGAAGKVKDVCQAGQLNCITASVRIGLEVQYHFIPDGATNPWLGYGIGYESTGVSGSADGKTFSVSAAGLEPIHVMGGVDFRVSGTFGVGPFVEFSNGTYTRMRLESDGVTTDSTIANTASHQWLTLGVRFVIFP